MRSFNLEEIAKWLVIGAVLIIIAVKFPALAWIAIIWLIFLMI